MNERILNLRIQKAACMWHADGTGLRALVSQLPMLMSCYYVLAKFLAPLDFRAIVYRCRDVDALGICFGSFGSWLPFSSWVFLRKGSLIDGLLGAGLCPQCGVCNVSSVLTAGTVMTPVRQRRKRCPWGPQGWCWYQLPCSTAYGNHVSWTAKWLFISWINLLFLLFFLFHYVSMWITWKHKELHIPWVYLWQGRSTSGKVPVGWSRPCWGFCVSPWSWGFHRSRIKAQGAETGTNPVSHGLLFWQMVLMWRSWVSAQGLWPLGCVPAQVLWLPSLCIPLLVKFR